MDTPVVDATDVTFAYDASPAVDGVSLTLEPGSSSAVLGPNGAGKTTFIRLVTGVLTPDSGAVSLFGEPVDSLDRSRIGAE